MYGIRNHGSKGGPWSKGFQALVEITVNCNVLCGTSKAKVRPLHLLKHIKSTSLNQNGRHSCWLLSAFCPRMAENPNYFSLVPSPKWHCGESTSFILTCLWRCGDRDPWESLSHRVRVWMWWNDAIHQQICETAFPMILSFCPWMKVLHNDHFRSSVDQSQCQETIISHLWWPLWCQRCTQDS